jgi:hypothetical protein
MDNKNSNSRYVSYCQNHNWESMERESYAEAQLDLEGHIGWFPYESHSSSGVRELDKEREEVSFKVSVLSESEHSIKIALCTGEELNVPLSLVSKFEQIGSSQSGEKIINIYSISLKRTTEEGLLVYELAKILQKTLNRSINIGATTSEGLKDTHTVQVQGAACTLTHSYYNTTFNIAGFALQRAEGCSVFEVIKTGARQLRIRHDAIGGTPCGNGYGAKVYIDIW